MEFLIRLFIFIFLLGVYGNVYKDVIEYEFKHYVLLFLLTMFYLLFVICTSIQLLVTNNCKFKF